MFKNKKKLLIVIIISIVIILTLIIVLSKNSIIKTKKNKIFDIDTIRTESLKYYTDDELKILDFIDVTFLFGFEGKNDDNNLFLANVNSEELQKENMSIIVIMNSDNPDYYYDIFDSYKVSMLNVLDNEDMIKVFENSILKKGNNYVYFILNKNSKEIEKDILLQYK